MHRLQQRMVTVFSLILLGIGLTLAQTKWLPNFYDQAGYISIKDAEAVQVGSVAPGEALQIGLKDVGLFTGHVCPGAASGFMLAKKALKALFGDQLPERGKIRVATMPGNDLANVAAYICGILPMNIFGLHPDLIVDPKLKPQKPGKLVLIFERKDTGKMVKAVFNKSKVMDPKKIKAIHAYKKKFAEGKAGKEDIQKMGQLFQDMVKKIVLNTPEGVFEVMPCTKYQFPAEGK